MLEYCNYLENFMFKFIKLKNEDFHLKFTIFKKKCLKFKLKATRCVLVAVL